MLSSAGDDRRSTLSWLWWFISWNKGEEPLRLLSTPDINKQSRAAVTEIESSRTISKFLKNAERFIQKNILRNLGGSSTCRLIKIHKMSIIFNSSHLLSKGQWPNFPRNRFVMILWRHVAFTFNIFNLFRLEKTVPGVCIPVFMQGLLKKELETWTNLLKGQSH